MPIYTNVWMGIFIYRRAHLRQFPAAILFTYVDGICICPSKDIAPIFSAYPEQPGAYYQTSAEKHDRS